MTATDLPEDERPTPEGAEAGAASAAPGAGEPAPTVPGAAGDGTDAGVEPAPASSDDMAAFEEQLEDSDLAEAHSRIASLDEDLARARADLYNLNQEYGNYVRRAKEAASQHRESGHVDVLEALIGVLDDVEAARAAGDLTDGPFAAIAVKLEETLANRFGFERFGAAGEDFDPALHEALMARTSAEVDHPVVGQVLQSGYRSGERVLRAAKVLVDNPE